MSQAAVQTVEPPIEGAAPPAVRLRRVRKSYGSVVAVAGIDLAVAAGEFFTLLGPSGSGKTTLLRMVAGFERPDGGTVELEGRDVTREPPYARNVNTVLQDFALFPHMSVIENVEYGLRVRRVPRAARRKRAEEALEMVRLTGLGRRKPMQLSEGERPRVAFARAIVNHPEVLLLDEPLGALDLKLREEMRLELKRIQQEVGITFLYVTREQEEALTMSDRLAVVNHGRLEQLGSPVEVYERPVSEFVASFIGVSNTLERGRRRFTIRPEKVQLLAPGYDAGDLYTEAGVVTEAVYLGPVTRYVVGLEAGGRLVAVRQNLETAADVAKAAGLPVQVGWRWEQTCDITGGTRADRGADISADPAADT